MKKFLFIITLLLFFFPIRVFSTSGACSYHGGVNCSVGMQADGKVICNDGWKESATYYAYTEKCQNSCIIKVSPQSYDSLKSSIENKIIQEKASNEQFCDSFFQKNEALNTDDYNACLKYNQGLETLSARYGTIPTNLKDCVSTRNQKTEENKNTKAICIYDQNKSLQMYELMLLCLMIDNTDYCTLKDVNSYTKDNKCVCNPGYQLNQNSTSCTKIITCPNNSTTTRETCVCNNGFVLKNEQCITYTEACRLQSGDHVIGEKDNFGIIRCYCEDGYVVNSDKSECIPITKLETPKIEQTPTEKPSTIQQEKQPAKIPATATQQPRANTTIKNEESQKTIKDQSSITSTTTTVNTVTTTITQEEIKKSINPPDNTTKESFFIKITQNVKNVFINIFKKLKFW